MKLKILFCLNFILFYSLNYSQVGIGTTSPTKTLDVNGDVRVRGLANSTGKTVQVSAMPDGTLVTQLTDINAPGTKFVGFLASDISLDTDYNFKEIKLTNELIDVLNEYNTSTGRYAPAVSGYYKISMDFDIGGYTSTSYDLDILIGLWDYTDEEWVLRRTFKHKDNNNSGMPGGRNESFGISNYLQLNNTHSYGFRIFSDYDPSATKNAKLKYQNTGSTGSSASTSFSIEKVL